MDEMDLQNLTIRPAKIDDLAAMFHLGEKVFTAQDAANLHRTWDEYEVTSVFNSDPEHLAVADLDGKVIGFSISSIIDKSRSAWTYGYLVWLAVDPGFTGYGVGGMLFDHCRSVMEEAGARMLMVDTQADNEPAIRFFTRRGFANPTDHVYLTLNLDKSGS